MTNANNFDFLVGTWTSRQRRLRTVLAGGDEWYEFTGILRCWSLLDGAMNVDEVVFPELGTGGVTLRVYDAKADTWSLYWASSSAGLSLPPVVGRFGDDGVGDFISPDVYDGREIMCRYRWSQITVASARWDQAFSIDEGRTWETNWVAEFTRTG
jgi:hypothetical protein